MKNSQETKQRKLTKLGDVWQLGDHRLACGSASDPEIVKSVVGENKVREVLTDPPYGVAYVENKAHFKETIGANLSNTTIIQGDELQSDEQYTAFTKGWIDPVIPYMASYNTFYIFNCDQMFSALRAGMKQAGIYYSQMIIWIKNTIVVGRKDYLPAHEVIAYGWHGRHKMERSKGKSVMYVSEEVKPLIFQDKPHSSQLHPTMKPVQLMRQFILNSTKIGEVVYDPFGGSGSTLIACEHTKRKCIMIEIDPNYVSTIIQRWETLTGKEATKI